jgi:hypothetical protein
VKFKPRNVSKKYFTSANINAWWRLALQCLAHINHNCTTNTKRWYLTSITSAEAMPSVSTCELVDVTGIFSPLLTIWLLWWRRLIQNITRAMVFKSIPITAWKLLTKLHIYQFSFSSFSNSLKSTHHVFVRLNSCSKISYFCETLPKYWHVLYPSR